MHITEVIEVTQQNQQYQYNSPRGSMCATPQRPHIFGGESSLGSSPILTENNFCPLRHSAHLQRIEVGKRNFSTNLREEQSINKK